MAVSRRERFKKINNFCLYYGHGREDDLGRFELAVVEPLGQRKSGVRLIKEKGALVLAYISVLELSMFHAQSTELRPDDFLCVDGVPLQNISYHNWIMDPRSDRWRHRLLDKAFDLIEGHGYDGLFLDTIGDVEDKRLPSAVAGQALVAAAKLVYDLRNAFPEHILVQNSGLVKLRELTARYVDCNW